MRYVISIEIQAPFADDEPTNMGLWLAQEVDYIRNWLGGCIGEVTCRYQGADIATAQTPRWMERHG